MDIPLPEECVAPPVGRGLLPLNTPPEFDIPLPSYSAPTTTVLQQPPPLPVMKTVPPPLPGLLPVLPPSRHPTPMPPVRPAPPPMQMNSAPPIRPLPPRPPLMPSTPPQPLIGPPPRFMPTPPPQPLVGPPPHVMSAGPPLQPLGRPPPSLLPPELFVQTAVDPPGLLRPMEKPLEQNSDESNKYSPSHASVEDDVPSPSVAKAQPPMKGPVAPRTTVLGKAQAKKRLLAFSMTKQGGGAGLSFGFAKKNAQKVGGPTAKEFVGPAPEPPVQPVGPVIVLEEGKQEKPPAPQMKKKGNRKASAREDKARSVIAAIEEIKREELVMRGVLSLTSLDTKCTGDMTAPVPLPGQPYVPPPSHAPLRTRELDMMSDLLTEKQRDKELLVEELLSRDLPKSGKEEKVRGDAKSSSSRDEKKESGRSRRERSHSREKKRRGSSKERRSHGRKEKEERRPRPTEMPTSWEQFLSQGYLFEEVRRIKAKQQKDPVSSHDRQKRHGSRDRRSRSREKKHRRSSPPYDGIKDKEVDEGGDLVYKVLSFPSKILSPLYADSIGQGTKAYPRVLVKTTKARPLVTFCENPIISTAFLKTRKEVFAESSPDLIKLMEVIMEGGGEKNVKKVDRNSKTSDTNLSNSLAALQVSYDEGELEDNLSSDDLPAGKRRERTWFCKEKDWFPADLDANVTEANVNGILVKENDGLVKEKEDNDEEVDCSKERKVALEVTSIVSEMKYSSPTSDHKLENKRLSLSEPSVECIKVRSKWDSDYEEDAVSVENVHVAVSVDKAEKENDVPFMKEEEEVVERQETPMLENELKTPENMDMSAESDTETVESHVVDNSEGNTETATVNNAEEDKADDDLQVENNISEPIVTSESEKTAESPKCEADVSLSNSVASPAANSSEKNTDLKLVSEYEEFMKAVSFDTCFTENAEIVEEEKNSNVSDISGNTNVAEEQCMEIEQAESKGLELISPENSEDNQCKAEIALVTGQHLEAVNTEDSEYLENQENAILIVQESKSDETNENNTQDSSLEVDEGLPKLPVDETHESRSYSSIGSDGEQLRKDAVDNFEKQPVAEDVAVTQSDKSDFEKVVPKKSKPSKEITKHGDEVAKVSDKTSKLEGKKSKLKPKHLKKKRKYTKVKHSKKKARRKKVESTSSESSSGTESSSSEEEKVVKPTRKREKRSRPSVSSDDSSSDESSSSSSSLSSTPSSSSSSSSDRRLRKKKKKQRKKVKAKKTPKKNKKEKVTQRRKHKRRKVVDSESEDDTKVSKSGRRKEDKPTLGESSAGSRSEEKSKRKHRTRESSISKTGSSGKHTSAAGQNNKNQAAKDDKKSKPLENSSSVVVEADNSSVESCWEASFKEKRVREKLKRQRSKTLKVTAGSDEENDNERKAKRRRKEHRSRSSSPKKKRHRSPSSSPEHSPTPKSISRDDKTRRRSRTATSQEDSRKRHSSSKEKKNRKVDHEEREQSKDHKELSKQSKQSTDNSNDTKARKRKKDSKERREKQESSKQRDRKLRSKSKDAKDKSKYKEKKDRSKSKEKRKERRHKEKTLKRRDKGKKEQLETSDDEVQERRKSIRSRYYRYRSKTRENSEKKKSNVEEESEKKKRDKSNRKSKNSDVNDSENQETENEDSENEETGNEDSENGDGEDSENQEDSENKEDSENQDSENHASGDDNESENEGSENQSSSAEDVDETVGSVTDQFDLLREIKQEVFSDDDVASDPKLQGSSVCRIMVVCKEERIDSNEAVTNVTLGTENNSAHVAQQRPCNTAEPETHEVASEVEVPVSVDSVAATFEEGKESGRVVEASVNPLPSTNVAEIPPNSAADADEICENSTSTEISAMTSAAETHLEDDVRDTEALVFSLVKDSEAEHENGSCSESSAAPTDVATLLKPSALFPSDTDKELQKVISAVDITAQLVRSSDDVEENITCDSPVKDVQKKMSDSVVLYSPGAVDSDDEDDGSKLADVHVTPQICKDNSLSSDLDVQSRGHLEVCSDMSLDSETCQTKSVDSFNIKNSFEASSITDSYTADFFCGSSWNSTGPVEITSNIGDSAVGAQKTPVSLENIPLPPPKMPLETNVISSVPVQAVPSAAVVQSSSLLGTSYPIFPVITSIQPCPPPLPPVDVTPKLKAAAPKAPTQKHVITVKLLSTMSRQEAMSAASVVASTSSVEAKPLLQKSDLNLADVSDKLEAAKTKPILATNTQPADSVNKTAADASPWKAFGTTDNNKVSLYDELTPVDGDCQVSPTARLEQIKEEQGPVVAPAEQTTTLLETPQKRARKRPSRWGMMTPPVKDAYFFESNKPSASLVSEEVGSAEKRSGPIFQIISGEKSSGGSLSSVSVDIRKLESPSAVEKENIPEQTNSQSSDVPITKNKVMKLGSDLLKSDNVDSEKSTGDVVVQDGSSGRNRVCSKSKERETYIKEPSKPGENERGSSDRSRQRRDREKDRHRDRGRERGHDRESFKSKDRDRRHRDRSREREGHKSDSRDSKKTSEKKRVDKSSDHVQPLSGRKEVSKEKEIKIEKTIEPVKTICESILPHSQEPPQSEPKITDHSNICEQPQQLPSDGWGVWPVQQVDANCTGTCWDQTTVGHQYHASDNMYPTQEVHDDGWHSRVVTYHNRSLSPSCRRGNMEDEAKVDGEQNWVRDTNSVTQNMFEHQNNDRKEDGDWHCERVNDSWKVSPSRSPLSRHRSPAHRRNYSSPPRRSPCTLRRRSRSPSFARSNLGRSSRSPTRNYSPYHRHSNSPYHHQSRSPSRRTYSPVSMQSHSPATRQNYSPRRSQSPSTRRSPLLRVRSPSQRRNRSPLPKRSCSRSPLRRSRSPVSRRSPTRRNRSPLLRRSLSPHYRRSRSHTPLSRRSRSPSPLSRRSRSPPPRRSRSPLPRRSLTPSRHNRSPLTRRSPTPSYRRSCSFSPGARRNSCSPHLVEGSIVERDHKDKPYANSVPVLLAESNWETTLRSREQDPDLSSSSVSSQSACPKRSVADSTISDSELIAGRKAPQNVFYPESHEHYYSQSVPVLKELRDESHSPSPMFSPKRISLDDRIRLELGVKLKSPPPPLTQAPVQQQSYQQEYLGQYPCYYTEQGEKQLTYSMQTSNEVCYVQQQPQALFPVAPSRRPPLLPVPAHVKPDMSQWQGAQAQLVDVGVYGTQQKYHASDKTPVQPGLTHPPLSLTQAPLGLAQAQLSLAQIPLGPAQASSGIAANSHVVQVGNFLQVVPAELPADTGNMMAALPPPPPPLPAQSPVQKPLQTVVLQSGNVLQVIPNEHTAITPPLPATRTPQKVVQVGNVLEVVPAPVVSVLPPTPSPARLPTTAKSLISLPLPPLPLSGYSSPPSPFLREHSQEPVSPPCGEPSQPSSTADAELRREQKEKRRQEKERRRLEKDKKKRNKLKLATGNIIKKALQQDRNLLDDSHEVDVEDMKLIEEAIVKVAELEEEEGEQPLSPVPKKKKKKMRGGAGVVEFKPLPAAGKGILVFPGFSKEKLPTADDSMERKTVKFADGVRPGEGTSPSAGEDLPSPPPPPRKLPKEKHFKKKKKKKIKVKIIRQINMDDDEDDDDISPPPPPPGSPPPPPVFHAGYPGFPAPGFLYSQAPQYTVLTTEPVTSSGAAAPMFAPLYQQHHHTTTTTHTTTVQFAAPPPPPPPAAPRKPK